MGTNPFLALNAEKSLHVDIMRAIARDFHDIPMTLKGGTALLLCYGLDRFSEDLDFDAPKKFNIVNRIDKILSQKANGHSIRTVKDTETVQRLKIHYKGVSSERLLKIETSFRDTSNKNRIEVIDGIRTYSVDVLIEQKINALQHRTAARDLYDIAFLVRRYANNFSNETIAKLSEIISDPDTTEQRFSEAFEEDPILNTSDLTEIILKITDFLQHHP